MYYVLVRTYLYFSDSLMIGDNTDRFILRCTNAYYCVPCVHYNYQLGTYVQ